MLVDREIIQAYTDNLIDIIPFDGRQVNPNSYDVLLSDDFFFFEPNQVIDPREPKKYGHTEILDKVILKPQDFILGATKEVFSIPNGIVAQLNGKSSWGRLGLTIHQTAGFIDSGFRGSITLELFNAHRTNDIILRAGDRIGQMVFFKTNECDITYGEMANSKYQNQIGAVSSRYYRGYNGKSI